jgi:hypothetical protein
MPTTNDLRESKTFDVRTTVTFAAAHEAFERDYASSTEAGAVLERALQAFEITTDGTSRYYLLHDGVEVAPDQMIGALIEAPTDQRHHRELHLRLRTETTSGTN